MREMNREELMEMLEQYYEAAGFKGVKEKALNEKSTDELRELYKTMIEDDLVF